MSRGLRVRTRLSLIFAALFLASGAALVAAMVVSVHGLLFAPFKIEISEQEAREIGKEEVVEQIRDQLRTAAMRRLAWNAGAELLVVTVVAGAVGAVLAGRMLARVRQVTEAARSAGESNLHQRLNLPGPRDEIKDLGDTFDAMLARLDEAFAAQRRFVGNASHELRTPLAVTRTAVEVTLAKPDATPAQLRAMGEEVRTAMTRAQQLVESLLVLSRSDQRVDAAETDDLADLAAEAMDLARAPARARGLRVRAELAPAPVRGDLALLSRAVANLLENAVRHNHDGGEVGVHTGADERWSWVTVTNTGPDLSAMEVARLLEPFNRGERTRLGGDGVGLGLSIVQAVARAHDGTIELAPRAAASGGLTVTLRLPVAAGQSSAIGRTSKPPAPSRET